MPFNNLTPAQAERLTLLAEECAEVIQAVTKIQRHGYESRHPDGGPTNRQSLEKELGQVNLAVELMLSRDDIAQDRIENAHFDKSLTLNRWLHHNSLSGIEQLEEAALANETWEET